MIYVLVSSELSRDGGFPLMTAMAERFTADLELGYTCCVTQVSNNKLLNNIHGVGGNSGGGNV